MIRAHRVSGKCIWGAFIIQCTAHISIIWMIVINFILIVIHCKILYFPKKDIQSSFSEIYGFHISIDEEKNCFAVGTSFFIFSKSIFVLIIIRHFSIDLTNFHHLIKAWFYQWNGNTLSWMPANFNICIRLTVFAWS